MIEQMPCQQLQAPAAGAPQQLLGVTRVFFSRGGIYYTHPAMHPHGRRSGSDVRRE
jgi:hypothetical protein